MKRLFFLALVPLVMVFSRCEKKDPVETEPTASATSSTASGTNASGTTTGTNAVKPGKVVITASWTKNYQNCSPAWTVKIGLGFSSSDVANSTFFAESFGDVYGTTSFSKELDPGTYYYKATKTYNKGCGTINQPPPSVSKSGSFVIKSGQTNSISAGNLD